MQGQSTWKTFGNSVILWVGSADLSSWEGTATGEQEILGSAAKLPRESASKDHVLALDNLGHPFSVQLLIRKSSLKN